MTVLSLKTQEGNFSFLMENFPWKMTNKELKILAGIYKEAEAAISDEWMYPSETSDPDYTASYARHNLNTPIGFKTWLEDHIDNEDDKKRRKLDFFIKEISKRKK